jgi:hypothetical protein
MQTLTRLAGAGKGEGGRDAHHGFALAYATQPFQTGSRFSAKARAPSFWSSLP